MTLQQLVYFLAVARTRHFTRAAEEVRVAQPSLSKQIHALEHELGAELFSRARGHIALTPAGEVLLPFARRIVADVESARLQVQELAGLRRGRLRVGAPPSLIAGLFAEVLCRYATAYPGIELRVEEGGSRGLVRSLTGGELDLALVVAAPEVPTGALGSTPILTEALVVASRAGDDWPGERRKVRPAELKDRPLVVFREGYGLRDTTVAACRAAGFEPRFSVQGGEMDAVLRFVEAGLGVAVVPGMVLASRPGLRGTPLSTPAQDRTIALVHRSDAAPTHAARAFTATLLCFLREEAEADRLPPGVRLILPPPGPGPSP